MIQELFLYDKERGLFKEILNQSTIMKGSYHVSPSHGNDLNTSNLETYIQDPATGLKDSKNYPICVCMTPRSRLIKIGYQRWEEITFNLYFVTTTYRTSDNKIKSKDPDTNVSRHHIWYDWQDMKTCAVNFTDVLKEVLNTKTVLIDGEQVSLRGLIIFDQANAIFNRLTKFNNDKLTGVSLAFSMLLEAVQCETSDEYITIDAITIPPLIIHSVTDD